LRVPTKIGKKGAGGNPGSFYDMTYNRKRLSCLDKFVYPSIIQQSQETEMRRIAPCVLILAFALCMSGCFSLPSITKPHELYDFTQDMRQAFTETELTKARFHISETLTLERELNTGEKPKIAGGKIVTKNGKQVQTVIIEPGIVCGLLKATTANNQEWLQIAFEDDDQYFLQFTAVPSAGYKYYMCYDGQQGQVNYGGLTYGYSTASGGSPYLKIDIDSSNTVERDVKKAKGRTIKD
jgi:hypothetical protein